MNVLIINHYSGSDSMGYPLRSYNFAKALKKRGHNVTIVTASFSHTRIHNPNIKFDFETKHIDDIRFLVIKTPKYSGDGAAKNLNMTIFILKLYFKAKFVSKLLKPDVIIAESGYAGDIYAAHKIAKYSGAKLYFTMKNMFGKFDNDEPDKNKAETYKKEAEAFAAMASDKIITVLPQQDRYISDMKYKAETVFIPNAVSFNCKCSEIYSETSEKLRILKRSGCFIVMYFGQIKKEAALQSLIDASKLCSARVMFVISGTGPYKKELKAYAEKKGYLNVIFFNESDNCVMRDMLSYADCLYIGVSEKNKLKYGVGMQKIYDYMLARKPIIFAVPGSDFLIEKTNCGIEVPPDNAPAIAEAVKALINLGRIERERMGYNAIKYVIENNNCDSLAEKIEQELLK